MNQKTQGVVLTLVAVGVVGLFWNTISIAASVKENTQALSSYIKANEDQAKQKATNDALLVLSAKKNADLPLTKDEEVVLQKAVNEIVKRANIK